MTGIELGELAERIGGRVVGDPGRRIVAVRPLETAGPDHLAVLHNPRYAAQARGSAAGVILIEDAGLLEGRTLLVHPHPYLGLARVLELLHPEEPPQPGVHPSAAVADQAVLGEGVSIGALAVVEAGASIGARTVIGAGCVVCRGARIGEDCRLHPRVVVESRCVVGDRCVLQAGVVIGGDGFGFATVDGVHHKVPQIGRAVIEDDVEIGANSTVDRGSLADTVIGRGSKLDNLVMIAHNVRLGPGCLLAAQSGVAGSTRVGGHVMMGGQSGVAGHLEVGDGSLIAAKTAVFRDLPGGAMYSGIPARPHRQWLKGQAAQARVPELLERLRAAEERLARLEETGGRGGQ